MRLSRSLGLAAAAAAGLGLSSGAYAAGTPNPNNTLDFSAQSIALAATANTITLPRGTFPGGAVGGFDVFTGYLGYVGPIATGATVAWTAPTGNNITIADPGVAPPSTTCLWQVGPTPTAVSAPAGSGTNTITCTAPGGGPFSQVQLSAFVAAGTFAGNKVSISGPAVAQMATNTYPGLAPLSGSPSAQSSVLQITASGTGDPAGGIPVLALNSKTSFSVTLVPNTLLIDLGGAGLPAIAPGAGFLAPLANGTRAVSTAGYLGALWVNVSQGDLDARTGLIGINNPTPVGTPGSPASQPAITGTVAVSVTGDFATITSAYLAPNTSVPNENAANCTPAAPANALVGAIDAAKRNIIFATFPTSPNSAFFGSQPAFGVCLVTNGTQVIQESPTAGGLIPTPTPNTIQMVVAVAIPAAAGSPYVLTPAPSASFGSIQYQGSVFFAQQVFGAANLYPTALRAVNSSNAPVKIFAVLTKDVNNVVPETGNGSCGDTSGGPNGITSTCNTSFVANLTALSDPTGLSKGLLQANTAAYYDIDKIAALAGTTLPGGNLKATLYMMSPSSGVRFSAVSQNPVNLDLISVP